MLPSMLLRADFDTLEGVTKHYVLLILASREREVSVQNLVNDSVGEGAQAVENSPRATTENDVTHDTLKARRGEASKIL